MTGSKQTQALKDYINYLKRRVGYIKSGILEVSDNEINYCTELFKAILVYANKHKLYFWYLSGKLNVQSAMVILGTCERRFLVYAKRQRQALIEFIQDKEIELFAQFPFDNGEQKIANIAV